MPETIARTGAIDRGGLVQLLRDALQTGEKNYHHIAAEDAERYDESGVQVCPRNRGPEQFVLGERFDPVLQSDKRGFATECIVEEAQAERKEDWSDDEHQQTNDPRQEKYVRPEDLFA